jgi:hypothetical protein
MLGAWISKIHLMRQPHSQGGGAWTESSPMSEEGNVTSSLKFEEDVQPSAGILSQYVKDLSVESPNAPDSFQWTDQPQMDIQFNIAARAIQPTVHEAELKITRPPSMKPAPPISST